MGLCWQDRRRTLRRVDDPASTRHPERYRSILNDVQAVKHPVTSAVCVKGACETSESDIMCQTKRACSTRTMWYQYYILAFTRLFTILRRREYMFQEQGQRTMNGRANTRVVTRTETYATLQPTAQEDYFSYHPKTNPRSKSALQRPRIPAPLHVSYTNCSPLSAGPAGWKYTPLSARTPGLESFRHDHGVKLRTRLSFRAVLLNCRWDLLWDEDELPARVIGRCQMYIDEKYESVKSRLAKCGRVLCGFLGWPWRKLFYRRVTLDEVDELLPSFYSDDLESGPSHDTENVQAFLSHVV